ncbi:MAG: alpha-hydroxy-acid oxidizing protein, partial [Paracoccaceae bacterium]|nr:alpha-hydroxy-acid oxidizing protein [Paracoccaceae bacterium]
MSLLSDLFRPRTVDQRFPSIAAMDAAARRRIPNFGYDYMSGGIGAEDGLARNLSDLRSVRLVPRYLTDWAAPSITTKILGQSHAAPFGPGPIGLSGLMWPNAPLHIARGARAHNLPVGLSTYATNSIEEMAVIAGKALWFQLYPTRDEEIDRDLLNRFRAVGGEVLLVTVDIPGPTRRARDLASGLSVPPARDWRTYLEVVRRPAWAMATLRAGLPEFVNVTRYAGEGESGLIVLQFLGQLGGGHLSTGRLKRLREMWPGKLVVKGVLAMEDARAALDAGADGIVVSNHGGRQLDAAPTAVEVLPAVRQAVGGKIAILADGG